jgi:hypothetical protein
MGAHARRGQFMRIGSESVASGQSGARAIAPAAATLAELRPSRLAPAAIGGSVSVPPEAQSPLQQELSKEQTAVWIRALLRLEPELSMARLAEELGLSDRQLGVGLSLLIRRGQARVREAPAGLRVVRVEPAHPRGSPTPMPRERR